ncbi:MAG TPA: nucleotidyltransferase family protein [Polyangiaceae bacterium]
MQRRRITSASEFLDVARANPLNVELCARLASLGLPQCHLVAGCLYQVVWNVLSGQPPDFGIKDYDVFYYDQDLSWDAEDAVIRQVHGATRDLNIEVEVKNQARVHLWYEQRFGHPQQPFCDVQDSIGSYLVACTCIGVDVQSGALHAPYGFDDLSRGLLRKNPRKVVPDQLFRRKAESYCARWPWLRVANADE